MSTGFQRKKQSVLKLVLEGLIKALASGGEAGKFLSILTKIGKKKKL